MSRAAEAAVYRGLGWLDGIVGAALALLLVVFPGQASPAAVIEAAALLAACCVAWWAAADLDRWRLR